MEPSVTKFFMLWPSLRACIICVCILCNHVATARIFQELRFGDTSNDAQVVKVYISPSCPHCLEKLRDIIAYTEKTGKGVIVIFLVANGLSDLYVLSLLGLNADSQEQFLANLVDYASRLKNPQAEISKSDEEALKNSGASEPVKEEQSKLSGLGYPLAKILEALPDSDAPAEKEILAKYAQAVEEIKQANEGKPEIDLPLYTQAGKILASFP
ncbi:MAG: hypothetical protein LBI20_03060 [Holosporales bacterium]|nr:hypothetical protein [Holosporales bacterium]